ncbi:hypothetical protein NL676_030354 [Syzygium grande]|nr:hypothetical protein NL676_030354 [Syzygium grande]
MNIAVERRRRWRSPPPRAAGTAGGPELPFAASSLPFNSQEPRNIPPSPLPSSVCEPFLRLQTLFFILSLSVSPRNPEACELVRPRIRSPSLSPRNPRDPLTDSSEFRSLLASLMAKRRRTEISRIADPAARLVTYSKRRKGLFNKASELCRLCGARAAVVVFSPAGKPCSFGDPSADEIISDYLRGGGGGGGGGDGDGEVMPPMGLTQWAEWVQTEWDACSTEEDLESLILKYEDVRDCAREKLKALEDDSRVMVGAADSHELSDEDIDSIFENLNGQNPALAALLTEGDGFSASPEDPAAGDGSLADFDGHGDGFLTSPEDLADGDGSLAVEPTPVPSDLGDYGFDPEDFLNLFEDFDRHGDGLLTSLEDSAAGDGSLAMEPTPAPSDLGDYGFGPEDSLNLFEDFDGHGGGFLTLPEDSAVGGGSSRVNGYDLHDFAALEELDVRMEFLARSAAGDGPLVAFGRSAAGDGSCDDLPTQKPGPLRFSILIDLLCFSV